MKTQDTTEQLSVQAVAVDTLIISLCRHLARVSPDLSSAIEAAFQDAIDQSEGLGFLLGESASGQYFAKNVRLIETMRRAVGVQLS